jgi:hypothetical protein
MKTLTLTLRIVNQSLFLIIFLTVIVLSEKPTQNRVYFGGHPTDTEKEMAELKTKLDTLTSCPKKKYPFPMTSNQEIGWDNDDVLIF